MFHVKKQTAIAFALSAGLLLAPVVVFAQDNQADQQKKAEQERKKKADQESGLKGVQSPQPQPAVTQTAQQQPPPPKPQYQPPKQQPKPQPQPQPQPQWQQQSRRDDQQQKRERDLQQSQRQRDLIAQERQRTNDFDRYLDRQRQAQERRSADLRKQERVSQYRVQQQYLDHLREQQLRIRRGQDWDHFFFAPPAYRYLRAGRWYEVNEHAARLLQEAINYGYAEGYRAGEADRLDHWPYDYSSSYAYVDASYGYYGLYVSLADYNFYFREGFRRGYEDGYYRRYRYGSRVDGDLQIMGDVMRLIIDLRVLR